MYKDDLQKLKDFFGILNLNKFKKVFFVSIESMSELIKYFPYIQKKSIVVNNIINGNAILNLAQIIDRCFNSDFQQQLLREVKECWIERTKKQKLFTVL